MISDSDEPEQRYPTFVDEKSSGVSFADQPEHIAAAPTGGVSFADAPEHITEQEGAYSEDEETRGNEDHNEANDMGAADGEGDGETHVNKELAGALGGDADAMLSYGLSLIRGTCQGAIPGSEDAELSKAQLTELTEIFTRRANNSVDGTIATGDLPGVLQSCGESTTEAEVQAMMESADPEGTGTVALASFLDVMSHQATSKWCIAEGEVWITKAADAGHTNACITLGQMYYNGEGTRPQPKRAYQYWLRAGNEGIAEAQNLLGCFFFFNKDDIECDPAKAAYWWKLAADQGSARAQSHLGHCYFEGQGVALDMSLAAKYLEMAAEQGDKGAQVNLGLMHW
jgi:TPR repeat protein